MYTVQYTVTIVAIVHCIVQGWLLDSSDIWESGECWGMTELHPNMLQIKYILNSVWFQKYSCYFMWSIVVFKYLIKLHLNNDFSSLLLLDTFQHISNMYILLQACVYFFLLKMILVFCFINIFNSRLILSYVIPTQYI